MDTSNSARTPITDFILGVVPDQAPTFEESAYSVMEMTRLLKPDLRHLGFRELNAIGGHQIDRLIVSARPDLVQGQRMKLVHIESFTDAFYLSDKGHWLWIQVDVDGSQILGLYWIKTSEQLAKVFRHAEVSRYCAERLLSGLDKLYEEALARIDRRRDAIVARRELLNECRGRLAKLPE